MPRGGKRTGRPGHANPQRTDLNTALPATAVPARQYGDRTAQLAAQRAIPMAAPPTAPGPALAAPAPTAPPPGSFGDILRPTEHPDEPVTAGAPLGPGPGPEAIGGGPGDLVADRIRQLYMLEPTEELREILEELDS